MTEYRMLLKSSFFVLVWFLGLGSPVSSQIHKDSSIIQSWATSCQVERGYLNIADTTYRDNNSNKPTMGVEKDATGEADGRVISLGDGGQAIYALEQPLTNIQGPDFAVFENGFREQTPPQLWFLELAFVEVSSDGTNYVRFPAISHTQTETQVHTFGQLDTAAVENLAGNYPVFYGTAFDLVDIQDSAAVDINHITHIRVVDVVGSIDPAYASYDANGHPVNDPFPTPFWIGGFDLDALAILGDMTGTDFRNSNFDVRIDVFPNPVMAGQPVQIKTNSQYPVRVDVLDCRGRLRENQLITHHSPLTIDTPGLYFLVITTAQTRITKKLIIN